MTTVNVHTAELNLTTVKLSPKILKQLPRLTYQQVLPLLIDSESGRESVNPECVIGWIDDSVLDGGPWLLVKTGESQYGLFAVMTSTAKKFKQIFIV